MKLANPSEMKIIDEIAIERFNIPRLLLMENAAIKVAEKAFQMLGEIHGKMVVAVAGRGYNGGDALAAARHLYQRGCNVYALLLFPRDDAGGESEIYLKILESLDIPVYFVRNAEDMQEADGLFKKADLIIDGIFGTGIRGEVSGVNAAMVEAINKSRAKILSVDIPSGISGKTGQVCGIAVRAHETVTFSLPKPGLYQYPGAAHSGNVSVADIGIPARIAWQAGLSGELLDTDTVKGFLPERPADGHKGTFGKVLIITGSTGMTGAGMLASRAAFKTGTGLVYLAVPQSLLPVYSVTIPEAVGIPLKDEGGIITAGNLQALLDAAENADAVVIGPGLSAGPQISAWVNSFCSSCPAPLVIDADALNVLSPDKLRLRKAPAVITPHPGEFARLAGKPVPEVQKDRVEAALKLSGECNAVVVLKGAGTVIACPDGKYYINPTGHTALAVAGSGDVLAGMVGSLIGQHVPHQSAAALGVFIHGKCGEALASKNMGQAGITAGEICGEIPRVIGEIRELK